MSDLSLNRNRMLAVAIRTSVCALPLELVIETMRPLPIEPLAGAPSFVRGISIVRGVATPVVDLGSLLGMVRGSEGRFVTLRAGDRQVALCVDAVLGVYDLDPSTIQKLPPLVEDASQGIVEAIGTLDAQFLLVLQKAWSLPEEVWQVLSAVEAFG